MCFSYSLCKPKVSLSLKSTKKNRYRVREYIAAIEQAARRWMRMLDIVQETNGTTIGPEDALAVKSLALHQALFQQVLDGALAFRDDEINELVRAARVAVLDLGTLVTVTAARWGMHVKPTDDLLRSGPPAALLAGCLLRRTTSRNIGKMIDCAPPEAS
jgi:hypothetical protein